MGFNELVSVGRGVGVESPVSGTVGVGGREVKDGSRVILGAGLAVCIGSVGRDGCRAQPAADRISAAKTIDKRGIIPRN